MGGSGSAGDVLFRVSIHADVGWYKDLGDDDNGGDLENDGHDGGGGYIVCGDSEGWSHPVRNFGYVCSGNVLTCRYLE